MAWGVPKIGAVATVASGNITLAEPSGIASGDLMVACIGYRNGAAFTVPGDWNLVATQQSLGDVDATNGIASGVMMWTVRGGSAPTLTFNRTAGNVAQGQIIAYTGASATPYDTGSAATQGSLALGAATASITTAEDGELLVAMASLGDNLTTSGFDAVTDPNNASSAIDTTTAPTAGNWLARADTGTNTGADNGLAIADAVKATAGATGTLSATGSGNGRHVMIVGAFKMGAVTFNLAGTSAGTSTAAATLGVTKNLAGSSAGTSTAAADLSIATLIDLAGTSAGTSTAAATALITKNLAASSAGVATATADLLNTAEAVTLSQAAFRFYADGTETGSTALAAQDANHSIDVSAGNVNFQLRVRLQSIAGISLAGASAGTSTATATMTNTSSTINLAGLSAGTSTATADLTNMAPAGITLDTISTGIAVTGTPVSSPQTFSHTVTAGDVLIVCIASRSMGADPTVTFNGVAMTQVRVDVGGTVMKSHIFRLVAPDTGTHTVSIAHDQLAGSIGAYGVSLSGVHQTTPIHAQAGANGSDTGPMDVDLITTVADTWIIDCCAMRIQASETATMTAMTNRVERKNVAVGAVGTRFLSSTVGPAASAATYDMDWTKTFNHSWAISAIALEPA